jgi:hypothetical protein
MTPLPIFVANVLTPWDLWNWDRQATGLSDQSLGVDCSQGLVGFIALYGPLSLDAFNLVLVAVRPPQFLNASAIEAIRASSFMPQHESAG